MQLHNTEKDKLASSDRERQIGVVGMVSCNKLYI